MADNKDKEGPPGRGLTLAARICAIMSECKTIEKRGKNHSQGYTYVREADVADHVRDLLGKHGVACLPSVEHIDEREYKSAKGYAMRFVRVRVRYALINADNPEERYEIVHFGDSSDSGDKALYKAITGAHKYMMMRLFFIGADDDPENDRGQPAAPPPPAPQPRVVPANKMPAAPPAPVAPVRQYMYDIGILDEDRIPNAKLLLQRAGATAINDYGVYECRRRITKLEPYRVRDDNEPDPTGYSDIYEEARRIIEGG